MNIILKLKNAIHSKMKFYTLEHYHWSESCNKIKNSKNSHLNRRCFIIGNGPSLTANDLDKLSENSEITFAFNRIYHIFEQTSWRPTYYMSQD